eukprot:TRINITY_DN1491_c0_g1_i11.p1 TRINITY_DN1491_c0_g1~~TRINITY_DN1491_c0_g1_i11.p1  ORF type:complete len:209 (-),score=-20.23 TRINITY_DN1491_c0_g1_i11:114-740(-)
MNFMMVVLGYRKQMCVRAVMIVQCPQSTCLTKFHFIYHVPIYFYRCMQLKQHGSLFKYKYIDYYNIIKIILILLFKLQMKLQLTAKNIYFSFVLIAHKKSNKQVLTNFYFLIQCDLLFNIGKNCKIEKLRTLLVLDLCNIQESFCYTLIVPMSVRLKGLQQQQYRFCILNIKNQFLMQQQSHLIRSNKVHRSNLIFSRSGYRYKMFKH